MLPKFLKLFAANHSKAAKSLADKVAELQAQAEQEHAEAVLRAQEAHSEITRLWAMYEAARDEALSLKTLAEKLGDLINPAA